MMVLRPVVVRNTGNAPGTRSSRLAWITFLAPRARIALLPFIALVSLVAFRPRRPRRQHGQQRDAEVVVAGHNGDGACVRIPRAARDAHRNHVITNRHIRAHGRDFARRRAIDGDRRA